MNDDASGTLLGDRDITALDRTLPRLVAAFEPGSRQRIVAGLNLDAPAPDHAATPGYALLTRRLRRCARALPGALPADAGMRKVMKDAVVTFGDVHRMMAFVGRAVGAEEVRDAIDRIRSSLAPGVRTVADNRRDMILDVFLAGLAEAEHADDILRGRPYPNDADEGDYAADESFAEVGRAHDEPDPDWRDGGPRPSARIVESWDAALRAEVNGAGPAFSDLAGTMQVAVVTGFRGDAKALCQATGATLAGMTHQPALGLVLVDEESLLKTKTHNTPGKIDAFVRSLLDDGNFVVFVAAGATASAFVEANAVRRHDFSDCHGLIVRVAEDMAAFGHPMMRADGSDALPWIRGEAGRVPFARSNAAKAWLRRVYENNGLLDANTETILTRLSGTRLSSPVPARPGPATLSAVQGLDPTAKRRLALTARRLASPAGGRIGLLLSGPPGTGKTMLASLLARESGRHFVQASLSEWQASGYLNDFLAAMRSAFDEARRNAPSVLFIDEADSIGHRGSTGNRNDDYWNMVVNSMLECLAGLGDRGDVAVIGATNHPDLIDPAILREGRLGETIEIPLPDRAGRAAILASLLPEAGAVGVDPGDIADRLGTCSPADLDGIVKEIRQLAKEAGEPVSADHVEAAMRVAVGKDHSPRALLSIAIGLSAEALMTRIAYGDEAVVTAVSTIPGVGDPGRLTVDHAEGKPSLDTAGDRLRALHVALAPAAGRVAYAAGGARARDNPLDCFTHLRSGETASAQAHALALVDSGAVSLAAGPDPAQREALARRTMARAWKQAMAVMRRNGPALEALTDLLVTRRRIDGETFSALAEGRALPPLH